ncbi:MAG: histidine kinase, partial [Actinomycetota bacterium]|nr:histidine kinase [Actinomycetota bacterium]
ALQSPRVPGRTLADEVAGLVSEATASLGFRPTLRLEGPVDHGVDDAIGAQLLAVLREALSNVVRHAGASVVTVTVEVSGAELITTVTDDGAGAGAGRRPGGNGLASLHHRAEALGGTLRLEAGANGRGTTVRWRVPLSPEGA